jgi:hypothetical protein
VVGDSPGVLNFNQLFLELNRSSVTNCQFFPIIAMKLMLSSYHQWEFIILRTELEKWHLINEVMSCHRIYSKMKFWWDPNYYPRKSVIATVTKKTFKNPNRMVSKSYRNLGQSLKPCSLVTCLHELDPVALMHQTIGLWQPSTFGRSSNQIVPMTTRQSEKTPYQLTDLLHTNLEEAKDDIRTVA